MNKREQYTDNEVYFLGNKERKRERKTPKWIGVGICLVLILLGLVVFFLLKDKEEDYYFEPENLQTSTVTETKQSDTSHSYIERLEETVNDVPMYIYMPHNAELTLALAPHITPSDSSIICAMQAADIRSDNLEIVGDFVLRGEKLSRGIAKRGFCAIVGDHITIGVNNETPLLQQSINSSGYFFRQYPLVSQGVLVENTLKNKSIRRAIGIRLSKVVMIESRSNESLHDFSQALIDIGVTDAITLVGSPKAHGWYVSEDRKVNEYGEAPDPKLENVSYIVWRKK